MDKLCKFIGQIIKENNVLPLEGNSYYATNYILQTKNSVPIKIIKM